MVGYGAGEVKAAKESKTFCVECEHYSLEFFPMYHACVIPMGPSETVVDYVTGAVSEHTPVDRSICNIKNKNGNCADFKYNGKKKVEQ